MIKINSDVDLDDLNDIFDEMIRTIKERTLFREGDKLQLVILNENLYHPIYTGLLTISNKLHQ
jgi:hypothetical protein